MWNICRSSPSLPSRFSLALDQFRVPVFVHCVHARSSRSLSNRTALVEHTGPQKTTKDIFIQCNAMQDLQATCQRSTSPGRSFVDSCSPFSCSMVLIIWPCSCFPSALMPIQLERYTRWATVRIWGTNPCLAHLASSSKKVGREPNRSNSTWSRLLTSCSQFRRISETFFWSSIAPACQLWIEKPYASCF